MGSLKYQFKSAIDENFSPGLDKHSYKKIKPIKNKKKKDKIASFGYRRCLIKFSCNLCNYLKDNYPEVKNLKDIKPIHIEKYLDFKSKTCSYCTIRQYLSYLRVIQRLIKQTYYFNVNLTEGYKVKRMPKKIPKIRNVSMKYNDLSIVLETVKNSKSPGVIGIRLAEQFGLRVSEICKLKGKDIDLEKGILHIHDSKGKRSRNIPIDTLFKIELCKEIKEKVNDEERVCPMREDSLNKFLRRALIKNNITRYADAHTGIHSIRKMSAKEVNNIYRSKGMTKQQALDETSKYLGHNKNRNHVMNAYLKSK